MTAASNRHMHTAVCTLSASNALHMLNTRPMSDGMRNTEAQQQGMKLEARHSTLITASSTSQFYDVPTSFEAALSWLIAQ
jgi:hypothetical protein